MEHSEATELVLKCLEDVIRQDGTEMPELDDSVHLIGNNSLLDSLGLVRLIVDVEQRLESEHSTSLTLADERAMSQKHSPFRSVSALAEYICLLAKEQNTHV